MKKLFLSCILLFCNNLFPDNQTVQTVQEDKDLELLQEALEIVASMSENIANLAIQNKTKTGSAEMTKQEAIALVKKITDFVMVILKKSRQKKTKRTIRLHTQEELNEIIQHIADEILRKI